MSYWVFALQKIHIILITKAKKANLYDKISHYNSKYHKFLVIID